MTPSHLEKLIEERDRLVQAEKYDFARLVQIQIENLQKQETQSENNTYINKKEKNNGKSINRKTSKN
jgi:hypothetical protein